MKGPILVTGVTGYIGSHIVLQLLASDFKVKAVVRDIKKAKVIVPQCILSFTSLQFIEVPNMVHPGKENLGIALQDVEGAILGS